MYSESLKICWAKKGLVIAQGSEPSVPSKVTDLHSTVSLEPLKLVIKLREVVMWKIQPKSGHKFPAVPINTTEGCSSNIPLRLSSFLFFLIENLEQPKIG